MENVRSPREVAFTHLDKTAIVSVMLQPLRKGVQEWAALACVEIRTHLQWENPNSYMNVWV